MSATANPATYYKRIKTSTTGFFNTPKYFNLLYSHTGGVRGLFNEDVDWYGHITYTDVINK